jgi:hypothetical protein
LQLGPAVGSDGKLLSAAMGRLVVGYTAAVGNRGGGLFPVDWLRRVAVARVGIASDEN